MTGSKAAPHPSLKSGSKIKPSVPEPSYRPVPAEQPASPVKGPVPAEQPASPVKGPVPAKKPASPMNGSYETDGRVVKHTFTGAGGIKCVTLVCPPRYPSALRYPFPLDDSDKDPVFPIEEDAPLSDDDDPPCEVYCDPVPAKQPASPVNGSYETDGRVVKHTFFTGAGGIKCVAFVCPPRYPSASQYPFPLGDSDKYPVFPTEEDLSDDDDEPCEVYCGITAKDIENDYLGI